MAKTKSALPFGSAQSNMEEVCFQPDLRAMFSTLAPGTLWVHFSINQL